MMDAKTIAEATHLQTMTVLQAIRFPEMFKPQEGYFEDPHGQPVYVDDEGNVHHLRRSRDYNGWTI